MGKITHLNRTTGARKPAILITSESDPQDLVQQAARALASAPHRVFSRDGALRAVGKRRAPSSCGAAALARPHATQRTTPHLP
jgi:hypothetical protein